MPVPTAPAQEPTITEMTDIEVDRIDGVHTAANGFPILLMKSVDAEPEGACSGSGCGCCENCKVPEPTAKSAEDLYKEAEQAVYKRSFTADERKKLASEGKALPDGS